MFGSGPKLCRLKDGLNKGEKKQVRALPRVGPSAQLPYRMDLRPHPRRLPPQVLPEGVRETVFERVI
jgi:hypothetical protein